MGKNFNFGKGFTLIEIMIVVVIIALLAAIAIPNLLRAHLNANEVAAIAGLRAVRIACESYRAAQSPPDYPANLAALGAAANAPGPAYIGPVLETGTKQGYTFTYTQVGNDAYTCVAAPVTVNVTGERSFFVDQTGVVRFALRAVPTALSPPVE